MKPIFALVFASLLPLAAAAEGLVDDDAPEAVAQVQAVALEMEATALEVHHAVEVELASFLWVKRPIIVFADTPNDPAFDRQVRAILERADEFAERDVVLIVDAEPALRSEARLRLRPRGFMLAILDKDGEVKQRRPAPRTAREIMAVIDRFPLRRQEMLERQPSGRD